MTIILLLLAVLAIFAIYVYNSLIRLKNKCNEAWADIDTQLKRRYDLIPNIVETVKGYASHEAQTLEAVVKARSDAMGAQGMADKQAAENMLTGALKSLFALAENYPDLKANQNFLDLQKTLQEVEEHLQMSRRYYNATVRDFNTKIELFPNNIIAGPLGFKAREFFEVEGEERENVKVDFSEEQAAQTETPTAPAPETPATPAPEAPAEQPAATTEAPAEPAEQPATPTETPAAPTEQPAAPAEQPATPAEQPATPPEQPAAPAEQPATPAEQPATPAESPAAPAEQTAAPTPETPPATPETPAAPEQKPETPEQPGQQ